MKRAVVRLPVAYKIELWLHEDFIHWNTEQPAESEKVIDRRQAFALLPFIDSLRLLKPKIMLKLTDSESVSFSQTNDVFSRRPKVDCREQYLCHVNASLHQRNLMRCSEVDFWDWYYCITAEKIVKSFWKIEVTKLKIIPLNKQSKKAQREFYAKKRGDWNGVKPVTRVVESKKVYDRKKNKSSFEI